MFKVIFVLFCIWAVIENKLLLVTRHEKFGSGIKIAHVSDIHKRKFGKNNSRLCRRIKKESPDIIAISGDLVSRNENDFSAAESTLNSLCGIAPVYMIFGNHEQSIPEEKFGEFEEMLKRTDVILLRNGCREVNIHGRKINVYGLEQKYTTYKKNGGYRNLDGFEPDEMESLVGERPDGEVILLAHNPLFAEVYSQWGADYTLSGHVHGGAVRLFGKGMLSPERKLFPRYSKGVYEIGNMKLLVSGGLGKLRLFNPPEIVIYEI